jgi:hypothetical protein
VTGAAQDAGLTHADVTPRQEILKMEMEMKMKMQWKEMLVALCLCLCVCVSGVARAQELKTESADQEAIMKKWMEFMTPGAEHELLKYKEGKWKVKFEMWVAPGTQATVSEGTSEMKLILGGRYLVDSTKGTYNNMPFEGMGIVGYDKLKKKFVSVWIDNMGTGLSPGTGTYDAASKTYTYTTLTPDVTTGDYKRGRTVERIVNENEWVLEMYDTTPDGKEFVTMKGVYTRGKSGQ